MDNAPTGVPILAAEGKNIMVVTPTITRNGVTIWPCTAYDMAGLNNPTAWAAITGPKENDSD